MWSVYYVHLSIWWIFGHAVIVNKQLTSIDAVAVDHIKWRLAIKAGIQRSEKRREDLWEEKKTRRQH